MKLLIAPVIGILTIVSLVATQSSCRSSAQSYLEAGNRYYAQGKFADASLNYRKSLQKEPNVAESHYRLGLAELKEGHERSAYVELRRGTELAPGRDDIRIQFADVALGAYQAAPDKPKLLYDEVAGTADYLLKKDPNSFDGLRLRASVLSIDGKLEDALAIYKKANAIRALEPNVIYPMVQVLFRLNRMPEGEDLAKRFLRAHPDVSSVYDVLVRQYMSDKRTADAEAILKSKAANMPKDPTPLLQLASLYQQLQRTPEMSQTLNKILDNPKDFPQGHAIVGDFFANDLKLDQAMREYNAGLQSSVQDQTLYQKRIAKVLLSEGKRDQAIEQLNQVLKSAPEDSDSRLARAFLLRQTNDPAKLTQAVSEMNSLLPRNPNDEILRYNLGLAYLAQGDAKSARAQLLESSRLARGYLPPRIALAELSQRTRNYGETIRLADEILAIDPKNADGRLWRAAGLLGNKNYAAAERELNGLLKEFPESMNVNLHVAVLDTAEKKYKEAEARYLRIYKPGQQDPRPLEGLVQLYLEERQIDKALALLEEELKHVPESRPAHLLLASTAVQAGKLDLATQQYEWLRANDPKSVQGYASLGDVYQLKGDVNSALKSYQKARELAPNDPRMIAMIAYMHSVAGQNTEAIANLRKQLALDPENTIALNNLAFALADAGTDLDEALSLAERAQKKAPNNTGIADTLGWVYTKKGLNDSAIQIFNVLVKKYPEEPAFRYHLGVALLQEGKPAEAKAEFTIALSNNPPKDLAARIKEIISKIG